MEKKALLELDGKTYWLNLGDEQMNGFECEVLDGKEWRPVKKTEVDIFDLMSRGKVLGRSR